MLQHHLKNNKLSLKGRRKLNLKLIKQSFNEHLVDASEASLGGNLAMLGILKRSRDIAKTAM